MIHAYSELYLDNAMETLGEMFSYAVDVCSYDPDEFFQWFIQSTLAEEFGKGNPKYVAGLSGAELASEVVLRVKGESLHIKQVVLEDKSSAYWGGWILAYYQWYGAKGFKEMYKGGLTMGKVMSMYLLHEADVSKFVEEADHLLAQAEKSSTANLQKIRKARGMSQQQLSDASGVTLRMIQLYEQKKNDINCAAAGTVKRLAAALGCEMLDLL